MIVYKNEIAVKDYLRLRKAVGWVEMTEEQAEKTLKGSVYTIAAYEDSLAVGTARVVGDGTYMALIIDVMVDPEYQKRGIGYHMMKTIMEELEKSAGDKDVLMINLMSVYGRESFYKNFGFVERPNKTMGAGMCRWLNM